MFKNFTLIFSNRRFSRRSVCLVVAVLSGASMASAVFNPLALEDRSVLPERSAGEPIALDSREFWFAASDLDSDLLARLVGEYRQESDFRFLCGRLVDLGEMLSFDRKINNNTDARGSQNHLRLEVAGVEVFDISKCPRLGPEALFRDIAAYWSYLNGYPLLGVSLFSMDQASAIEFLSGSSGGDSPYTQDEITQVMLFWQGSRANPMIFDLQVQDDELGGGVTSLIVSFIIESPGLAWVLPRARTNP